MSAIGRNVCALAGIVSGSEVLADKLGKTEAMYAVERYLKRMERAVAGFKGRILESGDDRIRAEFESPEDAWLAACEMQLRVLDLPPVSGVKLEIRVGFHFSSTAGETQTEAAAELAGRLAGLARPGQILTTAATAAAVPAQLRQAAREMTGKDFAQADIEVLEVACQDAGNETARPPASANATGAAKTWLRLRHGAREIIVDEDMPAIALGRDSHSDIVIRDPRASRNHGRIERRRDGYVVIDQSTNGTYVAIEGEPEFVLRREDALLRRRGRLSFGHSGSELPGEVVEFEVLS
jgi:adenylate cyclase